MVYSFFGNPCYKISFYNDLCIVFKVSYRLSIKTMMLSTYLVLLGV